MQSGWAALGYWSTGKRAGTITRNVYMQGKGKLAWTPGPIVSSSDCPCSLGTRPMTRWKVVRPRPDQPDWWRRLWPTCTAYVLKDPSSSWNIHSHWSYLHVHMSSLVPRPPPLLPSICIHNDTREQKTSEKRGRPTGHMQACHSLNI